MAYQFGIYADVEITGQGFSESPNSHTPCFFFTILPGQYERTMYWYISRDPAKEEKSLDRLLADLEKLGLDTSRFSRFSQLDPRSREHISYVGARIKVQCSPNEYQGKTKEQWQVPYTPATKEELDKDGVARLDRMFGHKLKDRKLAAAPPDPPAVPALPPSPPPFNSPEALAEAGDDGIPF